MSPDSIAEMFKSDRRYQEWFKAWWAADFSVEGRKRSLQRNHHVAKTTFADREWPVGWAPPHDLSGSPNPQFRFLDGQATSEYSWSQISGDLSGAFLAEGSQPIIANSHPRLSHVFFGGQVAIQARSSEVDVSHSYIAGNLKIIVESPINFNIDGATVQKSMSISGQRQIVVSGNKLWVGEDLSIADNHNSVTADHMYVGGNASLTGTFTGSKIVIKGHLSATSNTQRGPSSINTKNAKVGGNIAVHGPYSNVYLQGSRAKDLSLSVSDCQNIDVSNTTIGSFDVKATVKLFNVVGSNIVGDCRWGPVKADKIDISSSTVNGHFAATKIETTVFIAVGAKFATASFTGCEFLEGLFGKGVIFGGHASFSPCAFPGRVDFSSAKFLSGLNFKVGSGTLVNASDTYKQIGEADFSDCEFGPDGREVCVDFDGRETMEAASFEMSKFTGIPIFFNCKFHENVSFLGATFDIVPPRVGFFERLSSLEFLKFVRSLKQSFGPNLRFNRTPLLNSWRDLWAPMAVWRAAQSKRLAKYERAYTALRQRFSAISNAKFERLFHVYELRARRKRLDSDATALEALISWMYDKVSIYGQSISRPLVVLMLIVWGGFAVSYFVIAGVFEWSATIEAGVFSGRQIVKPFSAWSRDFTLAAGPGTISQATELSDWLAALFRAERHDELVWTTLVRIMATVQSFLGLVLLFLSGLAARRTFGVN